MPTAAERRDELADALAACAVAIDLARIAFRRADNTGLDAAVELLLEASASVIELRGNANRA